jgi:hypothetical protein
MSTAIYHRVFGWVKEHNPGPPSEADHGRGPPDDDHRPESFMQLVPKEFAREAAGTDAGGKVSLAGGGNQPAHRPRNDPKAGILTEPRLASFTP